MLNYAKFVGYDVGRKQLFFLPRKKQNYVIIVTEVLDFHLSFRKKQRLVIEPSLLDWSGNFSILDNFEYNIARKRNRLSEEMEQTARIF